MSFQIHNTIGEALPINVLDREAAEFWGKKPHQNEYAYPDIKPEKFNSYKEEFTFYAGLTNWYDRIGWNIHMGTTTWDELYNIGLEPFRQFPEEEILAYLPVGGYLRLIKHWEAKGYKPVFVAD